MTTVAQRDLAVAQRKPSQRMRRRPPRDADPAQEGDADYGMSERRIYLLADAAAADPSAWLQIMPVGTYQTAKYGEIEITPERVKRFAKNFHDNVRRHALPVNREHVQELGAVGWFADVEARADGLYATFDWSDDGKDLLEKKAFQFFSPEYYDTYVDPVSGKSFSDVLVGCALTNYPQFVDLPAIAASEDVRAAVVKAGESYTRRVQAVGDALRERYGYGAYVSDVFEDHIVYEVNGSLYSCSYSITDDGDADDVQFGMPEEVRIEYVPLTQMAEWSTAFVNGLPDSSFAYIEPGGEKDDDGKTTPRSKRHFPIKDAAGKADAAHVRNALARAPQSPFGDKAMPKIRAAAKALGIGDDADEKKTNERQEERMPDALAGGTGTKTAPAPAEPTKASDAVLISASDLATLREQAAQAPTAMAEAKKARDTLRLMAVDTVITTAKREGRIVPSQEKDYRDRLVAASDADFDWLKGDLLSRPAVVTLGAIGSAERADGNDPERRQLHERATKYMSDHQGTSYQDALLAVAREEK